MSGRRESDANANAVAFGERFAAGQAVGLSCLALVCWSMVVNGGRVFPLVCCSLVLLLSLGFRRRAAWDAGTTRRAAEDERDARFVSLGDRAFRIFATVLVAVYALAFAMPGVRAWLLAEGLRPAGVPLAGLMLAHAAAHAVVWRAYVRDRQ